MSKYLVRLKIFPLGNFDITVDQYYVVNKKLLIRLKKLDVENDGACCGQGGCVACSFNGIRVKYQKAIKIMNEADMAIANFVCKNNYYEINEFFDSDVFEQTPNK